MTLFGLRRGSWVEVKSAEEILATLDTDGMLEGLPFMPEMLQYCGRRFQVGASAHKTCDTVNKTGIRSLRNTVHLAGLRCDGSGHGGCQASCLIYWRTEWLRRVRGPSTQTSVPTFASATHAGSAKLERGRFRQDMPADAPEGPYYRCQVTELPRFTQPARWSDFRLYFLDVWTGNASVARALRVLAIAVFNMIQRKRGGLEHPRMYRESWLTRTPSAMSGLSAGELVRVKSKDEILATLDPKMRNRGLSFDPAMTPFCGKVVRVTQRVEKIIDERSGRMLTMPNDCIMLDGVVCGGDYSQRRRMCPRAIPPYWREIWLERVASASES